MQLHNSIVNVIGVVLLLESADVLMRMHLSRIEELVTATNAVCPRHSADALTNLLKPIKRRDVLFAKHDNNVYKNNQILFIFRYVYDYLLFNLPHSIHSH